MRRATTIKEDLEQITTVEDLTQVFESIASMHISKIRGRVVASKSFFAELWQMYSALRVSSKDQLKDGSRNRNGRDVLVAITSESKFGGSSNDHVLETLRAAYPGPDKTDVMAIGSYGSAWLERHDIPVIQAFTMPPHDTNISVSKATPFMNKYDRIAVFYQTYDSLRIQKAARIDLVSTIRQLGEGAGDGAEVLTPDNFIFEPGGDEIADYLESVMMNVALIQVIMETKLADHANRFNSMSLAKQRAGDLVSDFKREFYRARRAEGDERLQEVMKVIRSYRASAPTR